MLWEYRDPDTAAQLQTVPLNQHGGGEFGKQLLSAVLYLRAQGFATLQSAQQYDKFIAA